jgi:hypothetical protein
MQVLHVAMSHGHVPVFPARSFSGQTSLISGYFLQVSVVI